MTVFLPYGGTSGWSGSETSFQRAIREDNNGVTASRQTQVLQYLDYVQYQGATWRELATEFNWHHGQASGVLSVLHKEGAIFRLAKERRNRCSVYVRTEYLNDREFEMHNSAKRKDETYWRKKFASEIDKACAMSHNGTFCDCHFAKEVILNG